MRQLTILLFAISAATYSNGQITKHNWLVGGSGFFNSTTYTNDLGYRTSKENSVQLFPNIGYFFADKFAGGLKLIFSTSNNRIISNGAGYNLGKYNTYGFGPFFRYYILQAHKQFNILIDGSYQYSIERGGGVSSGDSTPLPVPITQYTKNTFSIAGGPVIYFNTIVGLEFLIGYTTSEYVQNNGSSKKLQFGLGFQIHLENDK